MRDKTFYEWDVETIDKHGDVCDHHHADALVDLFSDDRGYHRLDDNEELVLVWNTGNECDGITDRTWAYVDLSTGILPVKFDNGYPVPKKFHDELARVVKHIGTPIGTRKSR